MTPAPQPGSPRRKSSIFLKLFCSVTLCVVLLLVFNWLLNSFVLVSYYQSAKEQSLRDAFTRVDSLLNGGSEQLETELYRLNGNENIKTIIWSRSTVLYNFRVGETMQGPAPLPGSGKRHLCHTGQRKRAPAVQRHHPGRAVQQRLQRHYADSHCRH